MASYEYMDVLAVKMETGDRYLAQAPWMSHIKVGDMVQTDCFKGTVTCTWDVRKSDKDLTTFIKALVGLRENDFIPKVRKHIKMIDVDYEEEEEE